ncbi:MAG TPA: RNA polymerase sigma factor [Pyrinomonadaceae bacterium]|nr:RNA polymerase sigma factor [Pyrinomonadaceae bacterium]
MKEDEKSNNVRNRLFWEQACEKYKQRLASYARRLVNGNVADADDLVQETMVRVLVSSGNPAGIETPIAYLYTVMRNAWITKWRKEHPDIMDSLDDLVTRRALKNQPAVEPDVLLVLENQEYQQDLKVRKGPLNDRESRILELYLDGYKCNEIAEVLDEDKRIISVELNAVRTKVRYRLKTKGNSKAKGV